MSAKTNSDRIFTLEQNKTMQAPQQQLTTTKLFMCLMILLSEASKQKPQNKKNRGNALIFTSVWWSNDNIPKRVLPSMERYSHFNEPQVKYRNLNIIKKSTSDVNTKQKFCSTQGMCSHTEFI